MMYSNISIVGDGNIAKVLGHHISKSSLNLVSICSRNANKSKNLASLWNCKQEQIENITGDLVLVCVSDDSVIEVIEKIQKEKTIAYCSGSINLDEINHQNCGVLYPLQTFSGSEQDLLKKFPLLIESKNEQTKGLLFDIGKKLSEKVIYINSEERRHIHLSAVFINNFSNHMVYLGQDYAKKNNLPTNVFNDLIEETFNNLLNQSAFKAQTGPAKRGDKKTIALHHDLLPDELKKIYLTITSSIDKTYN